ncbi:MAG TPA: alkyl sulfatase dimerization domain-containing protein, partial [Thermomicrobiales bacterium]|nr:alkyl sulfatase dimerization domain-containing protein [Thermomicrobiales bacterium]
PDPLFLTGQNLAFTQDAATVPARLTAHARTMAQGVYRVAEQFYVAVGYGQANMTMVVGTDGVLIIDCLENEEVARQALADLRRFSDRPIRALIYSHSHPDHISGVRALLDPADVERGRVAIYAHERLPTGIRGNPSLGLVPPLRLAYTFGLGLERGPEGWVETGLGTQFWPGTTGFLPPTTLFRGSLDIEVAGIRVQLREAPSESDDELVVWFPDRRVAYVADVVQGESLPNLYALRGAVRDLWQWIGAVDLLRAYEPEALIFGHGRPLVGRDEARELLTAYRDAIQYIHDRTVRLLARGLTPDELVEVVDALPPRLREHPWLGEFYGTVVQTVRQLYHNAFGWWEGDPATIDPLPRRERAARYVAAMGGRDAVVAAAARAHADGDYRWAAEILTHVLRLDPDDRDARRLKADALRRLGYRAVNPIWRNNYLMGAGELDGTLDRPGLLATLRAMGNPDIAATTPIPLLLRALATRLNPAHSEGVRLRVGLRCTDTGAGYGLAIRSEVAEPLAGAPPDATLAVETTEPTLRGLLTGRLAWPRAVEDGAATLTRGTAEEAARFWGLFDPPMGDLPALALR